MEHQWQAYQMKRPLLLAHQLQEPLWQELQLQGPLLLGHLLQRHLFQDFHLQGSQLQEHLSVHLLSEFPVYLPCLLFSVISSVSGEAVVARASDSGFSSSISLTQLWLGQHSPSM